MMNSYPSLRIEGGLFSPDLLEALNRGDLPGQKPQDFGLPPRRALTEEIAAIFHDARALWQVFRHRLERLPEDNPATSETRELWVIPLLRLLGYDLQYQSRAIELDGQSFAFSHALVPSPDLQQPTPVHIVGWRQDLGRLAPAGRPRRSPHALVQEYLNRSEALWGIVTNGRTLRLLRDCTFVRRQAYVEFDLEEMFEEQRFADFVILYRLLHRTRLPKDGRSADCLLETYYQYSLEQGGRVREHLREGVEECLMILANGFLRHPKSTALREWVQREGAPALYRQLLRLVYRFLFLLVSEERGLMGQNPLYLDNYGVTRLRRLCENRAAYTNDMDLWLGLRALWYIFQDERLAGILGVPPLNGELFAPQELDEAFITNHDLLEAFWHLAFYDSPPRRINYAALDTEELGSVYESLLDYHPTITADSAGRPYFELAPGSERKSTGSYYTPPQLVAELIRSALEPVIEDRLRGLEQKDKKARENALLSIKVCDPACGSGHFLLAAARRLGKELARIRTGEDEPAPEQVRAAIRDVVAHCIYGVDKNPLAVELARVALWLESHAEGKPLTFLEHRIKCGDSLVGVFDLGVLKDGLPDEAFDPLEGDDRKLAASLKRQNKAEREGQMALFGWNVGLDLSGLAQLGQELDAIPDDSPEQVRRKRERYASRWNDPALRRQKTACDLWTAAFFQSFSSSASPITTEAVRRALAGGFVDSQLLALAETIASEVRFFHWPLEFPEVFAPHPPTPSPTARGEGRPRQAAGAERDAPSPNPVRGREQGGGADREALSPHSPDPVRGREQGGGADREALSPHSPNPVRGREQGGGVDREALSPLSQIGRGVGGEGGFDVVLANPPWEQIQLEEQEFFASRDARIANAPNAAARKRLIERLTQENPALWQEYRRALHTAESTRRFLRASGDYSLTGRGRINTYSVFAERIRCLLAPRGRAGVILPTGIATDDANQYFFADLVEKGQIVSLFDFENRERLFPAVDSRMKFCLLTLRGPHPLSPSPTALGEGEQGGEGITLSFFATRAEHLRDPRRVFTLTPADIARINPNTRTLPICRTRRDAELTRAIYARVPVLDPHLTPPAPSPLSQAWERGEGKPPQAAGVRSEGWGASFKQGLFNMSSDSHLFRTRAELEREGYRLVGNVFVPYHQAPSPGLSPMEGERSALISGLSPMEGERSALISGLSPMEGERSAITSGLSPMEGEMGASAPDSSPTAGEAPTPGPSPTWGEGEDPIKGEEGKEPDRWDVPEPLRRKMVEIARQFRKNPTRSEAILWEALRGKKLDGVKFRRQQNIGPFVVDFYAPSHRLVVEVDGGVHLSQRELDRERQRLLESLGLRFVRIPAELVEHDLSRALALIRDALHASTSSSSSMEEGSGIGAVPSPHADEGSGVETFLSPHVEVSPSPHVGMGSDVEVPPSSHVGKGSDVEVFPSPHVRTGSEVEVSPSSHVGKGLEVKVSPSSHVGKGLEVKVSPSPHVRTGSEVEVSPSPRVGEGGKGVRAEDQAGEVYLPLYEAKMIWLYDHRFGTYEGVSDRSSTHLPTPTEHQHADPNFVVLPWYWVSAREVQARLGTWRRGWLLGFRRITNATNERTAIFTILPKAGIGDNVFLLFPRTNNSAMITVLTGSLISIVFDWVVRQKLAGMNMNFFYVQQFPVLPPAAYTPEHLRFIVPRVLELTYTAWDLKSFADDVWSDADDALRAAIIEQWESAPHPPSPSPNLGEGERGGEGIPSSLSPQAAAEGEQRGEGVPSSLSPQVAAEGEQGGEGIPSSLSPQVAAEGEQGGEGAGAGIPFPPFHWDEDRRARIRAELDAYYAYLYGLTRKQLRYILDPADLTERELSNILDPWEEVRDPLDPQGYAERCAASDFPGETFRVLKEKEIALYGEYRTRRLVLEAWENLMRQR